MYVNLIRLSFQLVRKRVNCYKSFFPDYYNYYYGGYNQNTEASDTQEGMNTVAAVDVADGSEAAEVAEVSTAEISTPNEAAAESVAATAEVCFIKSQLKHAFFFFTL